MSLAMSIVKYYLFSERTFIKNKRKWFNFAILKDIGHSGSVFSRNPVTLFFRIWLYSLVSKKSLDAGLRISGMTDKEYNL